MTLLRFVRANVLVLALVGYGGNASARYLQPEPLLQRPNYVQAMARQGYSSNPYAYALNNPIQSTDPSGLYSVSGGCDDEQRRLREAIERIRRLRESQNQCSSYLNNVAKLDPRALNEGPIGPNILIEPDLRGSYTSWNGDIHLTAADVGNYNVVLHEFAHYGDIASSGALNVALRGRRAVEALGVGAEQSCTGRSGSGSEWMRSRQWPW